MANIMTKRGQLDNVVTYQHFCDTTADLANIESKYCTLGSIAIVLQGDSGGLQIYIANSDKQWNPLTSGIGGGNGGGVANLPLEITNPLNGQILTYDSTSGKWINQAFVNENSNNNDNNFVIHCQVTWQNNQYNATLVESIIDITNAFSNKKNINFYYSVSYSSEPSTKYTNHAELISSNFNEQNFDFSFLTVPYYDISPGIIVVYQDAFDYSDNKLSYQRKSIQFNTGFTPNISNPQDGDTLVYNASQGKWINSTGSNSGGGTLIVTQVPSSDLLDKTFNEIKNAFLSGASVFLLQQRVESDPDYGNTKNSYVPLADIEEKVYTNPERTSFYHVYFGPSGYSVYEANSPDDYPSVAEI